MNSNLLCFDFDLTLTSIHTGGHPDLEKMYFDDINEIKNLLDFFSSKYKIYIITRGMEDKVKRYLEKYKLMDYFQDIYGANEDKPIERDDWDKIKVEYLDFIVMKENIKKNNIFFFDDTEINVLTAINSGYTNSFQVKLNDRWLLSNLKELFKFKTINDLEVGDYNIVNKFDFSNVIIRDRIMNASRGFMQKCYLLEKDSEKYLIMKHDLISMSKDILVNDKKWNYNENLNIGSKFFISKINLSLINKYFENLFYFKTNAYF